MTLKPARGEFDLLLDAIGLAVAAIDSSGRITLCNGAALSLLGYQHARIIGRDATELVSPEHRERLRSLLDLVGTGASWSGRLTARRADGETRPVSVIVRPLRDANGEVLGALGIGWDVSRELAAEARFRALFESASIGVAISSLDGMIVEWNPAMAAMLGHGHDALPIHTAAVTHPEDMAREERLMLAMLAGRGAGYTIEKRYLRRDGTIVWGSLRATLVRDENGTVICGLGIVEDITERKQMERELRESEKELRELAARLTSAREEEQARVARELHDDLGQRLTALKLDLAWLARKVADDADGPGKSGLGKVLGERVDGMLGLVDDTIRSMRDLLTELRPMILDDLGLEAAIEWHVGRFADRTGLRCHLSVSLPPHERNADRDSACFRILQEALTNVARHAQAREVWVSLGRDRDLCLEIRDDGVGISEVALARPAMGIVGMRERARALGGSVDVRRQSPRGTSIHARLPW